MSFRTKPLQMSLARATDGQAVLRTEFGLSNSAPAPLPPDPLTQPNTPATGAPAISGTVRVGEILTVDTSGIDDADGLDNVSFSYQWLANDTDVAGATGDSYALVADDKDKTIRVWVSSSTTGTIWRH